MATKEPATIPGHWVTDAINKYHLYMTGIVFVVALIPMLLAPPEDEYLKIAAVVDRTFLKGSFSLWLSVTSLCMYIPACLEIFLDVLASHFVRLDISTTLIIRLWVVVGGIGTDILMLTVAHATGSVSASYGILSMRGLMNITAFLHLMHLHCKPLYTRRWTYCLMVLLSGGAIIHCYGVRYNSLVLGRVGIFFFGSGVALFSGTIIYHFYHEYTGTMNYKSTMGYEILFVLSSVGGVCLGLIVRFAVIDNQQGISLAYRVGYTTFQSLLVYVAVTHEFKWHFSAMSATLSTKAMFVRFVSHEVRTPLNACILGLEYLEGVCMHEDSLSPSVIVSLTKEIRDSCEDAVEIANNLLLYEKVDGNALALICAPENIYHIVQKVYRSFQIGAQKLGVQTLLLVHPTINGPDQKDATMSHGFDMGSTHSACSVEVVADVASDEVHTAATQAMVYVDRPKLHVVLRNMVSNAIKFSTAYGHSNGKVIVSIDPIARYVAGVIGHAKEDPVCDLKDATYVRVSVQDNGAGISVENQKRMFGSIIQFDQNKLQGGGGSGMGLYISNKIVSLHDGCKIEVYSKGEGYGTTLSMYVPLYLKDISPIPSNSDVLRGSDLERGYGSLCCRFVQCYRSNLDNAHSTSKSSDNSKITVGPEDLAVVEIPQKSPQRTLLRRWRIEGMTMKDLCIMVVDDSGVNRRMLIRLLQRSGIGRQIDEAVDGVDFLQKMGAIKDSGLTTPPGPPTMDITQTSARLIVDDIEAKKSMVSAYDLCIVDQSMPNMNGSEAIEHLRSLGYEGLIAGLTGVTSDDDLNYMREKGADFVFTKPLRIQELVTVLSMCLHGVGDGRAE